MVFPSRIWDKIIMICSSTYVEFAFVELTFICKGLRVGSDVDIPTFKLV